VSAFLKDEIYLRALIGYSGYTPPAADFIDVKFYADSGSWRRR